MFNKLLFPIFSFVSVGGVAVGFSKYNNNSAVPVDSFLDVSKNQSSGLAINTTVNKTVNQLEEQQTTEYFYSVVEVNNIIEDSSNIECDQGFPYINPNPKFACAVFDINGSKDSADVITEIQQKINAEPLTLSAVTTAKNNRYYILRTTTRISETITKIGVYIVTNTTKLGTFDLKSGCEKNIQYKKTNK